jgi:glycosyltransferase involved in cell wall biosynthesis
MDNAEVQKPTVSVLIPVYNREQYIGECIQSALDQTVTAIEVIVVDNVSDDWTWEICLDYAQLDARVKVFQNDENLGPVRNWQRCLELSSSPYSKILFSDDLLAKNCLELMLARIDDPEVAFVYSAAAIGETLETANIGYSLGVDQLVDRDEMLRNIIRFRAPLSPGAILIRRKDLEENLHLSIPTAVSRPFSEHGAGPDVMISLLTIMKYSAVAHIVRPLVFFRSHPGSFSIDDAGGRVRDGYSSAIAYFLREHGLLELWGMHVGRLWVSSLRRGQGGLSLSKFTQGLDGDGSLLDGALTLWGAVKYLFSAIDRIFRGPKKEPYDGTDF